MKSDRWSSELDIITHSFKTEFANLTGDQLNWKPSSKQWSIAQCMNHLIVVNETYFTIVDQIRDKSYYTPWYGKIRFITKSFGNIILGAVNPDRRKKMKTFAIWEPAISLVRSDILDQFEKHQQELKCLITSCEDLLERKTVISSPANRMIVYKLETAFDIIVAHEKRHLEQAKEVNQCRANPA
jgi:DinB superfamily